MNRPLDSWIMRALPLLACLLAFGLTGCDDDITGSNAFEADDMSTAEARLHQQFDDKRVKGEWFELDLVDIEFIKSIEVFANGQFIGA